MNKQSRLAVVAPNAAKDLAALPLIEQNEVAVNLILWGLAEFPASKTIAELRQVFGDKDANKASLITEKLDERYFGTDAEPESSEMFHKARLASAVTFVIQGIPEEAIYELIHSFDDIELAKDKLDQILQQWSSEKG
jgi:hypothetical protein